MELIKITQLTNKCVDNHDGAIIFDVIKPILDQGDSVVVSFEGVYSVPSSFINSAFIQLLNYFPFDVIREKLRFVNSTKLINDTIKQRFQSELSRGYPRRVLQRVEV